MKEQRFWKCAALAIIAVGLYVGHGLHGGPAIGTTTSAFADEPQEKSDEPQEKADKPNKPGLTWENIKAVGGSWNYRSKIPGGWLVSQIGRANGAMAITFVPDAEHKWDGASVP